MLSKVNAKNEFGKPIFKCWQKLGFHPQFWEVAQGENGLIYVGNGHGMLIFDGERWQLDDNPNEVGTVFGLEFSSTGKRVYAGTGEKFGYFTETNKGKFKFTNLSTNKSLPKFNYVYDTAVTHNGVFFSSDYYIFWWREGEEIKWFKSSNKINRVEYAGGRLFTLEGNSTIQEFDFENERFNKTQLAENAELPKVRGLVKTATGQLLILHDNMLLRETEGDFDIWPTEVDQWMVKNHAVVIKQTTDGNIIIGSQSGGIAVINKTGKLVRILTSESGLPNYPINELFIDASDAIWTTQDKNICRIQELTQLTRFSPLEGVELVQAITRHDNDIYYGGRKGLFKMSKTSATSQAKFESANISNPVGGLLSHAKSLFIAHSKGITIISSNSGQSILQNFPGEDARQVMSPSWNKNEIYSVNSHGLARLSKSKGDWKADGALENFDKNIYQITEGHFNDLWLGDTYGSIYHITQLNLWPKSVITTYDETNGLPAPIPFRFGKEILFGTSQGIYRLSADKMIKDIRFKGKLNTDKVYRIAFDDNGLGWFSSQAFVARIHQQDDGSYLAGNDISKGLSGTTVYAIHLDQDGTAWIGRVDDILRIQVDYSNEDFMFSPLIRAANGLQTKTRLALESDKSINTLVLPMEESSVQLEFSYPNNSGELGSYYRTKLEGVDDEWTRWSRLAQKEYTNLPYDSQKFELQAKDSYDILSPVVSLNLFRQRPWYLSFFAYTVYLIAGGIILYSLILYIVRRRISQYVFRQREMETIVRQRTQTIEFQKNELIEKDEAKSRFFANVSHEFRTPLTLALGPLEEIRRMKSTSLSSDERKFIELAYNNINRMKGLLGQVLDFSRLEEGKAISNNTYGDFIILVKNSMEQFHDFVRDEEIHLRLNTNNDAISFYFDADHMERVITNLISNAVKFTHKDDYIDINIVDSKKTVSITVKDTGAGIEESDIEHIFDRYYQGVHQNSRFPGTGLGLALVKELVELQGGEVDVISVKGEGSEFRVLLNKKMDSNSANSESPIDSETDFEGSNVSLTETDLRLKTLLIVEDNCELREFIRLRLCARYNIIEAENGEVGLKLIHAKMPDIVVCDVMMPIMDGFKLVEIAKNDNSISFIPIILLTARSRQKDKLSGLKKGADDYLTKPFDMNELCVRIDGLLSNQQRLRTFLTSSNRISTINTAEKEHSFESRLKQTVDRHLHNSELSVEGLARYLHIDRTTLFRQVKTLHGCSPSQYIRACRLTAGKKLLSEGIEPINVIAYAVGFDSLNYFSRCFKQKYDLTPVEFRKL